MSHTLLSEAARDALINVGTNRIGAVVHPNLPASVLAELRRAGLIENYGMTRKGSIVRGREYERRLDAAFS